jgi:hypothetical protein
MVWALFFFCFFFLFFPITTTATTTLLLIPFFAFALNFVIIMITIIVVVILVNSAKEISRRATLVCSVPCTATVTATGTTTAAGMGPRVLPPLAAVQDDSRRRGHLSERSLGRRCGEADGVARVLGHLETEFGGAPEQRRREVVVWPVAGRRGAILL